MSQFISQAELDALYSEESSHPTSLVHIRLRNDRRKPVRRSHSTQRIETRWLLQASEIVTEWDAANSERRLLRTRESLTLIERIGRALHDAYERGQSEHHGAGRQDAT